jgi:nitrite reductase (NADH) small subunit
MTLLVDIGASDDFEEGRLSLVEVDGKELAVLCRRGNWYALRNVCPHLGAPLCFGRVQALLRSAESLGDLVVEVDRPVLMCPWHRWEFDLSSGRALSGVERIRMYPAHVADDRVYVDVSSQETLD